MKRAAEYVAAAFMWAFVAVGYAAVALGGILCVGACVYGVGVWADWWS